MKILLMSDVHGNLKLMDKIIGENKDCDLKFFMGDFELYNKEKQILESSKFDRVVTGNCDNPGISPYEEIFEINNIKIMMLHGHSMGGIFKKIDFLKLNDCAKENNVKIILHGHDHIADNVINDGITRFNPGSITSPRGGKKASYGILSIGNNETFTLRHIFL